MRRVRVIEQAAQEALEAAAWYESQRVGLGSDFQRGIEAALEVMALDVVPLVPVSGVAAFKGAKRLVLRRFPYDLIVKDLGDELVFVAFAHHSRRPGYWLRRI